jgi:hypothetical protein
MALRMGLLGKKIGMTQVFGPDGERVPVTAIAAGPCVVIAKRTPEKDKYSAIQLGFEERKPQRVNRPETGYFASNIRGEVVGREKLIALVKSERHCIGTDAPPATGGRGAATPRPAPMVAIESTAKGVTGRADLGAAGYYDDEYVKTPKGWRIKARTVITGQEKAANITVQDTIAIRRLAGTDLGLFDDIYVPGPDGVKRFRTAGVALGLSAEGVTGHSLLKNDGGYYDDVYVRTQQGGWRFKSRVYVSADAAPAGNTPRTQP